MNSVHAPVLRDIVLVGGGHSHAVALRMFAMKPLPGVRLTLIASDTDTPYSGMLPGYVAGHYAFDEVHIDLRRLAVQAGARYFRAEAVGIDRTARTVICRGRPPVPYDVLSLNVGATPRLAAIEGAEDHGVAVKPIRRFDHHWQGLLQRARAHDGRLRLAVVGAGAGGVELTLAMQYRLRHERQKTGRDAEDLEFHLCSADPQILPTHNRAVQDIFARTLEQRGVQLHVNARVIQAEAGAISLSSGGRIETDEVIWVTAAGGPAWLRDTGLALDERDCIRVRPTLQSESDPTIFAAGDCAAWEAFPLEKAGVFAVRMGKPLFQNLRRTVLAQPLISWQPQKRWLALIGTGDAHAVASRASWHASGAWIWRWKDHIDRRFMQQFEHLPTDMSVPASGISGRVTRRKQIPLPPEEQNQATSALAMRCGGCGAKVGATVLERALAAIVPHQRPEVVIGLHAPDDAAVVQVPPGKAMVHTVDFFRDFIDDPWLFGRIAANHALGDIFAMGAQPASATAIVTVPPGLDSKVAETLQQMLTGAVDVLNAAGCTLVGGHTGEGAELALGFAVNGWVDETLTHVLTKGGLQPGELLVLTKPLGTGTLLAAHAQGHARGRWIDAALESMQQSNQVAARILREHGVKACTDLTGFGLAGHLLEMTRASGADATVELDALPLLTGAAETVAAGRLSSLQHANARIRSALHDAEIMSGHPAYPLLFDPQTAGGLLCSVAASRVEAMIVALQSAGYESAAVVGRVLTRRDRLAPIHLVAQGSAASGLVE